MDSVRILGLPNANKGEDTVFSEYYDLNEPQVFARIAGPEILIDLDNDFRKTYSGTGTIEGNSITLNSIFYLRARTNEYQLEGVKQDNPAE